ncbi:hypothetical protein [Burkholderia gladioli]|uniref:hypothetical protein n=1 Tax=Burkholderia gladioli TaxID=28095 RepID=UPI00163F0B13|nr:hypothetical protein [Burkholderia gladioli]
MKKIGTFLVTYGAATCLIVWAAFRVSPLYPMLMLLEFAVVLYPLAYVETLIHEIGHVLTGLVYGVSCREIRVGGGPVTTLWRSQRITVKAGLYPGLGHVDFQMLPLSRRARVVMYAGGVGATAAALPVGWILIPVDMTWLRVEMMLYFVLAILGNLFLRAPAGKGVWSDGDAIRGLLRYGF